MINKCYKPVDKIGVGVVVLIKSFWHMTVSWKSRKVQSRNCDLSKFVIFEKPKEVVHVSSTLGTAGKTIFSTPSCLSL